MGDIWLFGQVNLSDVGNGWIIIEGIDGTGYMSDIAVDDLELTKCVLTGRCILVGFLLTLRPDDSFEIKFTVLSETK